MQPANEIQPVIELQFNICIPLHSVQQAQHDLFATSVPAPSFSSLLQGRRRGGRRAGGRLFRGSLCKGQRRIAATKFEGS